jgi:hypothetical protein
MLGRQLRRKQKEAAKETNALAKTIKSVKALKAEFDQTVDNEHDGAQLEPLLLASRRELHASATRLAMHEAAGEATGELKDKWFSEERLALRHLSLACARARATQNDNACLEEALKEFQEKVIKPAEYNLTKAAPWRPKVYTLHDASNPSMLSFI